MQQGVDYIGVSVGALIINSKKEILLLKRSEQCRNEKGSWEAPGGSVHFNETLQDAIKREMREELGVDIEILEQFPAQNEILPKDKQHWVATAFLFRIKKGQTPRNVEPEKHTAIGWFALDNLPKSLSLITRMDIEMYKKEI